MKNQLVFINILFILIATSCHKSTDQTCSECNNKPNKKNISICLEDINISSLFDCWEFKSINLTYKTLDSISFLDLSNFINDITKNNESLYSFVLYTKKHFKTDQLIKAPDLIGISCFYQNDNKLHHSLYKRVNNGFQKDQQFDCEVSGILSNDLNSIAINQFDSIQYPSRSWILIFSEKQKVINTKNSKHELSRKLILSSEKSTYQAPPNDCEPPCIDGGENPCHLSPLYGSTCNGQGEEPCLGHSVEQSCIENSISFDQTTFNYPLQRQLRDNYLINSQTGQTLIEDYYLMSEYFHDKLSASIAYETALVLYDVNQIIPLILQEDTVTITIDSTFAENIKTLIDSYISICDSDVIRSKLVNYKLTVDSNIGKTGQEVQL